MPIAPHLRHHYTTVAWRLARAAALRRSGGRCEGTRELVGNSFVGGRCGLAAGQRIRRRSDTRWLWLDVEQVLPSATGWDSELAVQLTVAHLDHDPANHDLANLAVLCRRCHLVHDRAHHDNSRRWRRLRLCLQHGQTLLFPDRFPDFEPRAPASTSTPETP